MADSQFRIAVVLSAYDRMTAGMNKALGGAQSKLNAFSAKSGKMADAAFKTGGQLVASGLAVAAPLYKAVDAAMDFENKMIDIRKQMKTDTPATVAAMTESIYKMGREIPLATGEIQDMVASGLRMGIAEDKIIDYTKQVSKMSIAFDMGAGEIADSMGKIANVYNIPIDKVGDFADAINYLDDNTMAKGPELIDVLQRIGGSAKNLSPNSAAALSATMLSLGESAETSGSAISAMLNRMSAATMQSGKFKAGLSMLGMQAGDLQARMSDPSTAQGAMMEVFERINKLPVKDQTEALVRLFGADHGPKLMKLANNTSALADAFKLVQGAEKGSMDKEYAKRVESTSAKMQLLKNSAMELAVRVGETLLPYVKKFADWLMPVIEKMGAWVRENKTMVVWIAKGLAIFSALAIVGGYLSIVIGGVMRAVSILSGALGFMVRMFNVVRGVIQVVWFLLKWIPIVRVIALVILLAVIIYKYWTPIKEFVKKLWGGIVDGIRGYISLITAIFKGVVNVITWPFRTAVNFIMGLLPKFRNAGSNIISSIWEGIKGMVNKPVELIKNMVGKIRNMLPFSPAKDGPLRDIHRIKLVETIAASIKPESMINAMRNVAVAGRNALFGNAKRSAPGGTPAPGGSGPVVNININLSGGASQNDATMVLAEAKKQFQQWMKGHEAQKARVSFA